MFSSLWCLKRYGEQSSSKGNIHFFFLLVGASAETPTGSLVRQTLKVPGHSPGGEGGVAEKVSVNPERHIHYIATDPAGGWCTYSMHSRRAKT